MTHTHRPLWTPAGYRATCGAHYWQRITGAPGQPGDLIPGDVAEVVELNRERIHASITAGEAAIADESQPLVTLDEAVGQS